MKFYQTSGQFLRSSSKKMRSNRKTSSLNHISPLVGGTTWQQCSTTIWSCMEVWMIFRRILMTLLPWTWKHENGRESWVEDSQVGNSSMVFSHLESIGLRHVWSFTSNVNSNRWTTWTKFLSSIGKRLRMWSSTKDSTSSEVFFPTAT